MVLFYLQQKNSCIYSSWVLYLKNKFDLEIICSRALIRISSLSKWKDQKVTLGLRNFPDGKPKIKNCITKR